MKWPAGDVTLAGDFNCVQSPALDRLGGQRGRRPESAALGQLTEVLHLEDAFILTAPSNEDEEDIGPLETYTYWGPESSS